MIFFLNIYKNSLSVLIFILFGRGCRFSPTCSEYAANSIQKYGIFRGTYLSVRRVLRCHPWSKGGYDPVK